MKFVAVFASSPSLTHFRQTEFIAVAETLHVQCKIIDNISWMQEPESEEFCIFECDDLNGVKRVSERCVLLRAIYILFQAGNSLESILSYRKSIFANIKNVATNEADRNKCTCPVNTCDATKKDNININNDDNDDSYHDQCNTNEVHTNISTYESEHECNTSSEFGIYIGESEWEYLHEDYCYHIETIGKKYTQGEKNNIIEQFCNTYNNVNANDHDHNVALHMVQTRKVNYTTPTHSMFVFIHHARQETPHGATQSWSANGSVLRVFHCKLFATSCRSLLLHKYDLKTRLYIGTTSMPVEESFVMANLAHVQEHDWVYDPFCGTGSLLIAASALQARTIGSEVDGRAMRGGTWKDQHSPQVRQQRELAKRATLAFYRETDTGMLNVRSNHSSSNISEIGVSEEELESPTMLTNFKVYRLALPERVRLNFATWPIALAGMRTNSLDAIITDPPYGIREPRKVVSNVHDKTHEVVSNQPSESIHNDKSESEKCNVINEVTHSIATITNEKMKKEREIVTNYCIHDVCVDLLAFAAFHLRVGGHLTFFYPTTDNFSEDELPTHSCMRLKYNIPQRLSLKFVRRLITFEKICDVELNNDNLRESSSKNNHIMTKNLRGNGAVDNDDNVFNAVVASKWAIREQIHEPRQSGTDLRVLMDVTDLPHNEAYTHYRSKLQQKRMAAAAFHLRCNANATTSSATLQPNMKGEDNASRFYNTNNNYNKVLYNNEEEESNVCKIDKNDGVNQIKEKQPSVNKYSNNIDINKITSIENVIPFCHEKRPRKKGCVTAEDIVNNRARKLRAREEAAKKNNNSNNSHNTIMHHDSNKKS